MDARPGLLDQVRDARRTLNCSYRTGQQWLGWIRRYIVLHGKLHPREMGAARVEAFPTHLAVDRTVFASTRNQTLAAILSLYPKALQVELSSLDGGELLAPRSAHRRPARITVRRPALDAGRIIMQIT